MMQNVLTRVVGRLMRRKVIRNDDMNKTDLARCLTLVDLIALGIGSTLGAGAYVISGQVAKQDAGPAVVISFFIAAVASVLAGLCYAEFGARVPKAGSAYVYTYVTVGELMAFVIGWNLILEYVIGAASVARTASGYFDDLIGNRLIPWYNETMPLNVPTLASHVDLLALGITLVLTLVLTVGVKESAMFTKIFTCLNIVILSFVILAGIYWDDPKNWRIPKHEIPNITINTCGNDEGDEPIGCGQGGFAPYGFGGIMKGAATCFFAFVGFDAIATTGEEAKNPQRSIPLATVISLGVVFVMYFAISLTITMMAPYYDLNMQAPFASIFETAGWVVPKYIVSVGAICALTTSLLGSMLPMPRVILAMARDGLIFRCFAYIHPRLKTPIIATLVSGSLAGVMAAIFDVHALVEMMSIGTLLAYTLVSASVLLLRYEPSKEPVEMIIRSSDGSKPLVSEKERLAAGRALAKISLPNPKRNRISSTFFTPSPEPSPATAKLVKYLTTVLIIGLTGICTMLKFGAENVFLNHDWWALLLLILFGLVSIGSLMVIAWQPQSHCKLSFKVPWIPFFPTCSIFFNIYLMVNLEPLTWGRFLIWMAAGFAIYFAYGMWNSVEDRRKRSRQLSGLSRCVEFECGEHPSKDTLMRGISDTNSSESDEKPTVDEQGRFDQY